VATEGAEVLIYSGGCPVCRYFARCVAWWDGTLCLVPLRHPLAAKWIGDIDESTRYTTWYYIDAAGKRWPGSHGGGTELMLRWRLTRWLAKLVKTCGVTCWVDRLDACVKKARPVIAKFTPERREIHRFPEGGIQ
jgi:predicted DCC family thiol-disulfide oxidoreductase YuxK